MYPGPSLYPCSPECVEYDFCELLLYGVLRSSLPKQPYGLWDTLSRLSLLWRHGRYYAQELMMDQDANIREPIQDALDAGEHHEWHLVGASDVVAGQGVPLLEHCEARLWQDLKIADSAPAE